jgi:hypothetical protein
MEPDPGAVNYVSMPLMTQDYQHADPRYAADPYMVNFDHFDPYMGCPPQPGYSGPHGIYMPRPHSPHSPHSPSEHSRASPPHGTLFRFFYFYFLSFFFLLFFLLIYVYLLPRFLIRRLPTFLSPSIRALTMGLMHANGSAIFIQPHHRI